MTEPFRDEASRNEFDWEKEIRKDDTRVHDYLAELPRFIDLPEEDKVIYKRIRRHGEKWTDFAPLDEKTAYTDDQDEDEVGIQPEDILAQRDGTELYSLASKMAITLTINFAVESDNDTARAMMKALAYLGKIMARTLDIVHLEDGEMIPFRIAMTKRFLSDVNNLIGEFEKFPEDMRDSYLRSAFSARDTVLASLRKYRSAQSKP